MMSTLPQEYAAVWFRRDLRLEDHAALYHALRSGLPVIPVFIFDRSILDRLEDRYDRRVEFIHHALSAMQEKCRAVGTTMIVRYGHPFEIWNDLCREFTIRHVYTNHDYEPYSMKRDQEIRALLNEQGCVLHTFKDQVIFEKDEILSGTKTPYTVFTPYSKKWREQLRTTMADPYPSDKYIHGFAKMASQDIPSLKSMNFFSTGATFPSKVIRESIVKTYDQTRDHLELQEGTTRLSVH